MSELPDSFNLKRYERLEYVIEVMNESEYLTQRVDDQIDWYDKRSRFNQKWFRLLRIFETVFAGSIPLLAGLLAKNSGIYQWLIGLLGFSIAFISALISLFKFQENWIGYRSTCEALKRQKFLYLTKTNPYDMNDRFENFVKQVETIISDEHSGWTKNLSAKSKEKRNG